MYHLTFVNQINVQSLLGDTKHQSAVPVKSRGNRVPTQTEVHFPSRCKPVSVGFLFSSSGLSQSTVHSYTPILWCMWILWLHNLTLRNCGVTFNNINITVFSDNLLVMLYTWYWSYIWLMCGQVVFIKWVYLKIPVKAIKLLVKQVSIGLFACPGDLYNI